MPHYQLRFIIPILFFISGSAGLIYEIIWSEMLTTLLGSSAIAITIILTAFMGGLALGSWVIGSKADRWSDRRIALTYVGIEVIIGVYALGLPTLLSYTEAFYVSLYAWVPYELWISSILKSSFSMLILLVPTFMMGGTLPLISRYLSRNWNDYTQNVSLLYGLNTLGAILGTVVAGFYLLANFGISGATWFAASINFVVAASFFILMKMVPSLPQRHESTEKETAHESTHTFIIVLLASYVISGAAAMFYQVGWTRTLSLILGTSTYAFTTMLATFLTGIALGSIIYRKTPKHWSRTTLYVSIQLLIVVSVVMTIPLFDRLPIYYLSLRSNLLESWEDLHIIRTLLASMIMFLPTLGMGLLFPIVCDLVANRSKRMSHVVGRTYALNAMGAMFGAAIAGLLMVPAIGLQNTLYMGAFLSLIAGLVVLLQSDQFSKDRKLTVGALSSACLIFFVVSIDPWSPRMISSGVYIYAKNYYNAAENYQQIAAERDDVQMASSSAIWEAAMKNYELLYYKDGRVDTVAVMQNREGVRSLMVNGKIDASARGEKDIATQIMIGQLPLLLHKDPQNVFLVGYASGMTAGAILTHPIRSLQAAEISPTIVEASKLFNQFNGNPLADPRLDLQIRDARQMLMTSDKQYDVIVSQPSNPWIKGQSSLFAYEWYNIVKDHLTDDGLLIQWLPAYNISERNLKIIINTLNQVFPNLSLWTSTTPGDVILLASKNPEFKGSYAQALKRLQHPSVASQIAKAELNPVTLLRDTFLMNDREIQTYLLEGLDEPLPLNTDDRLITEYLAPKNMLNRRLVKEFTKAPNLEGKEDSLKRIIPDIMN